MVLKIRYKLNFLCTNLAAVSICINAYSNTYVNIVHLKNKPKVNFGLCPCPVTEVEVAIQKKREREQEREQEQEQEQEQEREREPC